MINSYHKKQGVTSMKQNIVSFSTTLSKETKSLLDRYCKKTGIRINHFLEQAILEKLEDEMDVQLIEQRQFEELVPWKKTA